MLGPHQVVSHPGFKATKSVGPAAPTQAAKQSHAVAPTKTGTQKVAATTGAKPAPSVKTMRGAGTHGNPGGGGRC